MSDLRTLQAAFHARVSRALAARGAVPMPEALGSVAGDARASADERLAIYERMYFHRLYDVVLGDYPRLAATLGEDAFDVLVADYLLASPPAHPSLRNAGARLGRFLAEHALGIARPWLADLALLERARVEVFDAADNAFLELEVLRQLEPTQFAELPLQLVAAHLQLTVDTRALDAWRDRAVTGDAVHEAVIVWRGRDWMTVYQRVLSAREVALAPMLVRGATFGVLCEALAREMSDEDAAQAGANLLMRWVDDGLLRARPTLEKSA